MEKKTNFIYDKDYDNLIISNKQENEKVENNYIFGDFIISIAGNGKVVSLEILQVSNYLKKIGFDPKIMENIQNIELMVEAERDYVQVSFQIFSLLKQGIDRKLVPVANLALVGIN